MTMTMTWDLTLDLGAVAYNASDENFPSLQRTATVASHGDRWAEGMFAGILAPLIATNVATGGPVHSVGRERSRLVEAATERAFQSRTNSWMEGHLRVEAVVTIPRDVPCAVGWDKIAGFDFSIMRATTFRSCRADSWNKTQLE